MYLLEELWWGEVVLMDSLLYFDDAVLSLGE